MNTFPVTKSALISSNGKLVPVPAVEIGSRTIISTGQWLKLARIMDEEYTPQEPIPDPEGFARQLVDLGLPADIFSFAQHFSNSTPQFPKLRFETDNAAVADVSDYKKWWESLPQETRKNTRRAERRGVTTRVANFDDELVAGIKSIYDENPIRQGRKFWHYGKDLETVRRDNATYVETSDFIASYHGTETIGFIKVVRVGDTGRIMQILSKSAHADKRPTNALLVKAAEVCSSKGIRYFVYGKYTYDNKKNSPIIELKRRHGFVEVPFPRYFLPLTAKGRVALQLGLHESLKKRLPAGLTDWLLKTRAKLYDRKSERPAAGSSDAEKNPGSEGRQNESTT